MVDAVVSEPSSSGVVVMWSKAKKYEFRGQMMTIGQIAALRDMSEWTVRFRLRHGIDLEAPLHSGHGRPATKFLHKGVEVTYEQYAAAEGVSVKTAMMRRSRGRTENVGKKYRRDRTKAYLREHGGEVLIDGKTPFKSDDRCWYVTAVHPDGITLDEVGQLLCVSRERVRQIENKALRKLERQGLRLADLKRARECAEQLGEMRERSDSRFNPAHTGVHYLVPPTALPNGRRRAS